MSSAPSIRAADLPRALTPAPTPHPRFTELPQADHAKTLRASGTGTGSQQTRVRVRDFAFVSDEPVAIGGRDEGPTPMEYLAGAVNACITVVIDQSAARCGLPVDAVQTYTLAKQDTRGLAGKAGRWHVWGPRAPLAHSGRGAGQGRHGTAGRRAVQPAGVFDPRHTVPHACRAPARRGLRRAIAGPARAARWG